MKLVTHGDAASVLRERGAVYVWARAARCCRGRQLLLEASLDRPTRPLELSHAVDGFQVWTSPGLPAPDELHLELDRKGRIRAYWNNQSWIG